MNKMMPSIMPTTVAGKIAAVLAASLVFVMLALSACAGATSVPASAQVPTPAAFQIDDLSVYPARVSPGQQVVITAKVTNKGGIEGEYIGRLEIDNTLDEQKNVTLPAGATQTLDFSTFRYGSGTYTVGLGGLTGQFEVLAQAAPTQTNSVTSTPSCCQQTNTGTARPSCCGGSGPSTSTQPTRRSCCGG
jgi:hypothetical protein